MSTGPVQAQAFGLTALLGLKGQDLPKYVADDISLTIPVFDLMTFMSMETIAVPVQNAVLGNNFFTNGVTGAIPGGELWYVHAFTIQCTLPAGGAIRMAPLLTYQNSGLGGILGEMHSGIATDQIKASTTVRPFLAPPGGFFGFFVENITGAANPVQGSWVISRLRI